MRLFTAISLSPGVHLELDRVQGALRRRLAAKRWQSLAQAHLTVDFIGETPEPLLPALEAMLADAAAATAPFTLALGELGAFTSLKHPRVLWVGLDGDRPALLAMEARMRAGLTAIGLDVEDRAYRPHITLAREVAPGPEVLDAAAATAIAPHPWRVAEVALFRSELKPSGAVHTVVGRYPLLGGA